MTVNSTNQKANLFNNFMFHTSVLITLGVLFRLFHFFYNRSLWMDEVYLASSILNFNFEELMSMPLEYQQKAPLGFLLFVKLFVNVLGNTEMALRSASLISAVVSLFLFVPVAKFFTGERGTLVGLALLAFAHPLVFHSVEIKQYSFEMLMTLVALYTYVKFHQDITIASLIKWSIAGVVAIWFSYSSIFVFVGIAVTLSTYHVITKQWRFFWHQLLPFSIWGISFLINYFVFTHKHAESKWIVYWFDFFHTFMPFPPTSMEELIWFPSTFYRMMDYPLGMLWKFPVSSWLMSNFFKISAIFPLLCFFAGWLAFFRERKLLFALLLMPWVFMCIASGLKLYPLIERFWVFICPISIIVIVNGFSSLISRERSSYTCFLLAIALLAVPFSNSIMFTLNPSQFLDHKRSFQREALNFLNENYQPGDVVYVYWNDLPGFKVYKKVIPIRFLFIEGKDHRLTSGNPDEYISKLGQDIKQAQNAQRIWVMYNDYYRTDIGDLIDHPSWYYIKDANPVDRFLNYMSTLGEQREVFKSFDVRINLVTLKGSNRL